MKISPVFHFGITYKILLVHGFPLLLLLFLFCHSHPIILQQLVPELLCSRFFFKYLITTIWIEQNMNISSSLEDASSSNDFKKCNITKNMIQIIINIRSSFCFRFLFSPPSVYNIAPLTWCFHSSSSVEKWLCRLLSIYIHHSFLACVCEGFGGRYSLYGGVAFFKNI